MNTVYEAIMKAAQKVESDPGNFRFCEADVPSHCGAPGCALGWIGFYLGMNKNATEVARAIRSPSQDIFKSAEAEFYLAMNNLVGHWWYVSAALAAEGLRLYAAKYHAPPARIGLPDIVREIFTRQRASEEMGT